MAALAAQGVKIARANKPELPLEIRHLWEAWVRLDQARPIGMGAAGGIPPSEIEAYGRLKSQPFEPWEVDTLLALDRARLEFDAKAKSES